MKCIRKIMLLLMVVACSTIVYACGGSGEEEGLNIDVLHQTQTTESRSEDKKETTTKAETVNKNLKVQDVVGKSVDNAKLILENQGFVVATEEEYSDDVEEGYVISQTPSVENDLTLSTGDMVTLTVSKGKEPVVAKYLDSIIYADFITGSPYNKMSAYSGEDYFGNECTRAIKFECNADEDKHDNPSEIEQFVKVTYLVDEGTKSFSCKLAPSLFLYGLDYIHVNLYKDEELIYSMDVSEDTKPLELYYDIEGAATFTIELRYLLANSPYDDSASIVFSEAKFE